jgi:hypothetical protein
MAKFDPSSNTAKKFNVGHAPKAKAGKTRKGSGKTSGRSGNAWRGYVGGNRSGGATIPFTGQF